MTKCLRQVLIIYKERRNMKKNIAIVVLILSFSLIESNINANEVDWPSLKKAFENYVNYPSSENASKVINLLPDNDTSYTDTKESDEIFLFVQKWNQLGMIERQVISKDRNAVKLAFKLLALAGGEFGENLDIILGTLIRIDPKLFLEELKVAMPQIRCLDGLLGNKGFVYCDRHEAMCLETTLRIEALESVKDTTLEDIRNICIKELNDQYNRYCK